MPGADAQAMNAHLAEISRTIAAGAHAILVLDGAGWHGSKALRVPDTITLLALPPYAPELNPVENVSACLRANRLAISVFETYEDIVARCCDAWTFFANYIASVRSIATREYAKAFKGEGRLYHLALGPAARTRPWRGSRCCSTATRRRRPAWPDPARGCWLRGQRRGRRLREPDPGSPRDRKQGQHPRVFG